MTPLINSAVSRVWKMFDAMRRRFGPSLPRPAVEEYAVLFTERVKLGGMHQLNAESVLTEVATVRLMKCQEYGDSRYEEEDPRFNQVMCFSDVHRKYIRARQQSLMLPAGLPTTRESLRETYLDLAAYAIMAVQLLDQESRVTEPNNSTKDPNDVPTQDRTSSNPSSRPGESQGAVEGPRT